MGLRALRRLLLLAPLLGAGACTRLFFQPSRDVYYSPESMGIEFREARFQSADGTRLTGAFFPALQKPAKGTVIQFHGNGENMTSHFLFAYWLVKKGYNLLVFDYRGYGASDGKPSLPGAVADGVAALRYARTLEGVDPRRLIVFGQSLGGALAVDALAEDGGEGVRAVVLESTFSSFRSVARGKLGQLWLTWPLQWPLSLLFSDKYSPARFIERLPRAPLLVIHGDADPVVPYKEGRALYESAHQPKEFWMVEGGAHTEAFTRFQTEYRPRLLDFLEKAR